jgi:hypothetical protein
MISSSNKKPTRILVTGAQLEYKTLAANKGIIATTSSKNESGTS